MKLETDWCMVEEYVYELAIVYRRGVAVGTTLASVRLKDEEHRATCPYMHLPLEG